MFPLQSSLFIQVTINVKSSYNYTAYLLAGYFIAGERNYFQFGFCSISYNCLHEIPLYKTHCGCCFIVMTFAPFLNVQIYIFGKLLSSHQQTLKSFSLKMYIGSSKAYDFCMLSCMLCFHVCTHVCFHLISNVHIVRMFQNKIPFQTFGKWHKVSYRYTSYAKSETSDIWRTDALFLKPIGERVEENHTYDLVKPNSVVKTRTVHRGYNIHKN